MQRRKKRVREKNDLPANISWKNEKDGEALTNNQVKMYLKQRGLKISGSKTDFTKRVVSYALEMLPEMFWKMKNLITHVKTTQFQNQSQVIPMERTHTLKSHLKYFLCLRKTSNA